MIESGNKNAGATGGAAEAARAAGPRNFEDLHEVLQMYNEVTQRLQVSHERLEQEVVRLREQLEEKNRELEHKKRLAALGEMAAGIAHEIRNPLGGIQLYASTLAGEVADRPLAGDLVRKISSGVKGLNSLVCDMLTFTREMPLAKREEDLAEIVERGGGDWRRPALLEYRMYACGSTNRWRGEGECGWQAAATGAAEPGAERGGRDWRACGHEADGTKRLRSRWR